jgi:hypothetical protein
VKTVVEQFRKEVKFAEKTRRLAFTTESARESKMEVIMVTSEMYNAVITGQATGYSGQPRT